MKKNDKSKDVVWVITHGLIIRQISIIFDIKTSKQIPYLTCFSLLEQPNVIRAEYLLFKNFLKNQENYRIPARRLERILVSPNEYYGRDDVSGRT